jgi:four helix bundle protein
MPYTYSFEKLQVWHDARRLVKMVYQVTEQLPVAEKYGLISQMRRASVSVVSNIAEGTGRSTKKIRHTFIRWHFQV